MLEDEFVGNEVLYFIDTGGGTEYVQADCQRDLSISISSEQVDASCKSTNKWGKTLDGNKNYTISQNMVFMAGATTGHEVFFDAIVASTRFTWQATHGETGDFAYDGTSVLTQYDMNFPYTDVATYDMQASGIGAINRGVVA